MNGLYLAALSPTKNMKTATAFSHSKLGTCYSLQFWWLAICNGSCL